MRTTQPITTKLGGYILLVMLIKWLDFWNSVGNSFFLTNFLWKFEMCFFKVKHSVGHISGMDGPIDVKHKGGASVGYWVNYVTLTFDFSNSNFKVLVSQKLLSDWCETKRKQVNQILGWLYGLALWPQPWTWPCSFKVNVWNSLIWGMGGVIDMERKRMWVNHSWPWPCTYG